MQPANAGGSHRPAPSLRRGTALDQEHYPLAFALVTNEGDAPAIVDDVNFNVPYKMVLYDDDSGEAPSGFDCVVRVLSDMPATIAPGRTVDLKGLVTWAVPPETPPMLAIVRGRFQTLHEGCPKFASQVRVGMPTFLERSGKGGGIVAK